jgi:quercetin dioxygenase-like cupin family protein
VKKFFKMSMGSVIEDARARGRFQRVVSESAFRVLSWDDVNAHRWLTVLSLVGMIPLLGTVQAQTTTQQEHVHQMSHHVMPFDISKTLHIFKMTEQGGVLCVVTKETGSSDQVSLIQQHLQHEAEQFQKGNYSDPALMNTSVPDAATATPKVVKVKLENDRVRVLDFTSDPGDKEGLHSHPPFVVYVVTGGRLRITTPDGKSNDVDFKAGDVLYRQAVAHTTENIGTTQLHAILVELKTP